MLSLLRFAAPAAFARGTPTGLLAINAVLSRSAASKAKDPKAKPAKPPASGPDKSKDDASSDFFAKYMDVDNDVRRRFHEIQQQHDKFTDAQKDIEIPLDGNEEKVKTYHDQITKLRKEHGLPDKVDIMKMLIKEKIHLSKGMVRKFVKGMESTWGAATAEAIMGIVSDVEAQIGDVLHFPTKEKPNPTGWDLYQNKLKELLKEHGLDKPMTKEEILFEETKRMITYTVEHMQHVMDEACVKMGIEQKFDARKLRTTITRDIEA